MTSPGSNTHQLEMAVALHRNGRLAEAEVAYRSVLKNQPRNADALNLLGVVLHARGQLDEAGLSFDQAIKSAPKLASIHFNRARLRADQARQDAAIKDYRKAIELEPAYADARLNLGVLLFAAGDLNGAVIAFRLMTQKCPKDQRGFYNFGRSLATLKRWEEAEAAYNKALQIDDKYVDALVMLAKLYADTYQAPRAVDTIRRVLAIAPQNALALTNLGTYLSQCDQFEDAIQSFDSALTVKPGDASAIVNRGLASLVCGQLASGWDGYASRAETDGEFKFARPNFRWPVWRGEDLKDRTLLVWGEQGFGDEILYASVIPDIAERAGAVTFACSPRLVSLFQRSFPRVSVVPHDSIAALKATARFDYHSSVIDLGRWYRRSFGSFPNRRAFLFPEQNAVAAVRKSHQERIGQSKRLIGFSWRSMAPHIGAQKTPNLDFWSPLFQLPNSEIIDLQYGSEAELAADRSGFEQAFRVGLFRDRGLPESSNFTALANHIAALDLVVTVSNTTAHLCGALGVPTIVVVAQGKGRLWYWFRIGAYSPWYPNLRIARNAKEFIYLCGLETNKGIASA